MKTILFSIPGSPPIVGNVTDSSTDEDFMKVEYPIIFLKEDDKVYTIPYMPLAKLGIVLFNRKNIVSISAIDDEIKNIRNWMIEGYTGKLSQLQTEALDQVISDRIRGFIPANKVVELLDLSNKKFGVGLSFRAAQLMSEKLELILNDNAGEFNSNADSEINDKIS